MNSGYLVEKRKAYNLQHLSQLLSSNTSSNTRSCTSAKSYISLNGNKTMFIRENSIWVDPGATATNSESSVVVSGTVDTNMPGMWYKLTYSVCESGKCYTVERSVYVDKRPSVSLLGNCSMIIQKGGFLTDGRGTPFVDPGATAFDLEDKDLTNNIVVTGLDINTSGDYKVKYTVLDSVGNIGMTTRCIRVDEPPVLTLNREQEEIDLGYLLIRLDSNGNFKIDPFVDPGANSTDDWDNDIIWNVDPGDIIVTITDSSGKVLPELPSISGEYTFTYTLTDSANNKAIPVSRIVRVDEPPVLTLNQEQPEIDRGYLLIRLDASGNFVVELDREHVLVRLDDNVNFLIDPFVDPGADATDDWDGNITWNIDPKNIVSTITDIDEVALTEIPFVTGVYYITYTLTDSAGNEAIPVTRTVRVDETPVLTLNQEQDEIDRGHFLVRLDVNGNFVIDPFVDPGANATDDWDGNIIWSVDPQNIISTITDSENKTLDELPSVSGEYTITYNLTDSVGNQAIPASRVVRVDEPPVITLNQEQDEIDRGHLLVRLDVNGNFLVDPFVDPGANSTDDWGIDSTGIVGTLKNSKGQIINELPPISGDYTIIYNLTDSAGNVAIPKTRYIRVDAPPVLTLNQGQDEIERGHLVVNIDLSGNFVFDPFVDPGANATDDWDGKTIWSVDPGNIITRTTNKTETIVYLSGIPPISGEYINTYSLTDSAGNEAIPVSRIIRVDEPPQLTLNQDRDEIYRGHLLVRSDGTFPNGDTYEDPGVTATDDWDADIQSRVLPPSNAPLLDLNKSGEYLLTYAVIDRSNNDSAQVKRTVRVDEPPVLTIRGDDPLIVTQGVDFNDPFVDAEDDWDDDIHSKVSVSSDPDFDVNKPGSYIFTYTATDSANNKVEIKRTVQVQVV